MITDRHEFKGEGSRPVPAVLRFWTPHRLRQRAIRGLFGLGFIALAASLVPGAEAGPLAAGRFGPALDAARDHAIVMSRDPYSELPLTVECWVRLRSATDRNDLLSSELVLSRGHWALFTAPGSGTLGLVLPGYAPAEIKTTRSITDNAWHHVALILEPDRVRLYVDAQEVAAQAVTADREKAHHYGWFLIGGEIDEPVSSCDGLIDEVRISRGIRPVTKVPDAPPATDATTVGLWHFDAVNADGETSDASPLASPAWLTAGRSMDEIDRLSFKAGPAPLDTPAQIVTLTPGAALHPTPVLAVTLDPTWRMAEGGADAERLLQAWPDAIPAMVPGSVHTALEQAGKIPDPKFGRNDAIAHDQSFKTWWFRQEFPRPANLTATRLVFDGVAIHCAVWLNGERLGEHDGMFGGPSFDVTGKLRDQNTLIVKIDPAPGDPKLWDNPAWRKLLVFNNVWGWHYSSIPALGIWRPVRIECTPAVRLVHPFIATRDAAAGEVSLVTELQGAAAGWSGRLTATIEPENFTGPAHHFTRAVKSSGATEKLHLQFKIPGPRQWWPVDLGEPNLYRLKLSFAPDGAEADAMETTFGLRTVTMAPLPDGPRADLYNWGFVLNGRPMFMKGTGWCTMDSSMDFSRERYARIIDLAKQQHVQMLRCWGNGMPETDDFFDLCDRAGITVLQEWPTATNTHREQPYDQLEETVRLNTLRIRNHPSLVMWGANNESRAPFGEAIDMMGRLAIEFDGTRPFHRAEPWGGSMHNYGCWWRRQPLDFNVTLTAPFLGEFGLATMPVLESVQRYLPDAEKNLWPAPPDGSLAHHTATFNTIQDMDRLTQYAGYFTASATMADFIRGSQLSQVIGLRHPLERARTRWPASAGALYYKMNDNYPAASWAVVDWYGAPKIGHYFCQQAYAPLHAAVVFESVNNILKPQALPVFLLDDASALTGARWEVSVRAYSSKFQLIKTAHFASAGAVAAPLRLGEFTLSLWQTVSTPIFIVSEVIKDGVLADRTFYFMNYETMPDCLFKLPRTTLDLKTEPGVAVVTNTGALPAVAVAVQRPGHADTFTAAENYLWLEPGETKRIPVSETTGLAVEAWNR